MDIMIWVLAVPIVLGVGILMVDQFASAFRNRPDDSNKCHRCGSPTRYHQALRICDHCSSVVGVDLKAMPRGDGDYAQRGLASLERIHNRSRVSKQRKEI
jgi:hypothetical protein